MSFKISKKNVVNLMILCIPLCPYKIFSMGEKDISFIYVIWALFILLGMFDFNNLKRIISKNVFVVLAIMYFVINSFLLSNHNWGSIFQFVLLWLILLFSYRRESEEDFQNKIRFFHIIMNAMAIYGIYEFVGRPLHLPLSDLWIDGYMVRGYNWYNTVQLGGITLYRSNGLFVEPSIFSQYLAINVLLYVLIDEKSSKNTLRILYNFLAIMCSLSGTGFILIFIASFIYFLTNGGAKEIKYLFKKYKILAISLFVGLLIILNSSIGAYFISRLSEFNPTNTNSISAYIRFIGQFNIASEIWKDNSLFGIGIGNVQSFIDIYRMSGSKTAYASLACSMILARYAAELGLIGVLILFFTFMKFFRRERMNNNYYKLLLICIVVMIPLCDSDISVNFWLLLYLINVDFVPQKSSKEICIEKK